MRQEYVWGEVKGMVDNASVLITLFLVNRIMIVTHSHWINHQHWNLTTLFLEIPSWKNKCEFSPQEKAPWCCIEGWWRINWTLLEMTQWSEHKRFLARGELGIRYLCLFVFKKTLDGGRMIVYEYGTRTRTRSKIIKRSKQNVEEIEITTITRGPGNLLVHVFSWYHSLWIILSDGIFIDIHVPTKWHLTVAEHNNVHL